ncbi:MAG TPA: hypothetical protein VET85_16830 [Stellaceae bacterium]|nr:hypothetical protein [Stellaceae bacterium]
MRISGIASVVAIAGVILWPAIATAGLITINLPADIVGASPGGNFHNATADGFRISPSCHFDEIVLSLATPGIGWDRSGCLGPGTGNPDYLGPPVPIVGSGLYVDDNGTPFDLLSIERIGQPFFAESSTGATETISAASPLPSEFDFTGSGWSGISWVLFFYDDPGAPAAGFDQMVVDVAEPPAIAVFGVGLLLLGCALGRPLRRLRRLRGNC